jgi:Arc-like DNA binding domain
MAKRKPTDIVNLKVRFPEAMRARLAAEAKRNQRSLNGEIVYRLGVTFGPEGPALVRQYEDVQAELARAMSKIADRLLNEIVQPKAKKD